MISSTTLSNSSDRDGELEEPTPTATSDRGRESDRPTPSTSTQPERESDESTPPTSRVDLLSTSPTTENATEAALGRPPPTNGILENLEQLREILRGSSRAVMEELGAVPSAMAALTNVEEQNQALMATKRYIDSSKAYLNNEHANSDPFYDSDFADEQASMPMERMDREDSHRDDSQEVDGEWGRQRLCLTQGVWHDVRCTTSMLEQERQRIEQLTADWEDPTQVDWGADDAIGTESVPRERTPSEPVIKCTALYSYTAQNPDELTIVENEQLEVIGEGDGDGWLRARNYKGEEGYVPHNYLDVETEHTTSTPGLVTQISFSSVDYTVDNEDETNQSPEQASVIAAVPQESAPDLVSYCCALYDYDGEGEEELTFEEGQVIKVSFVIYMYLYIQVEGRAGNFPSLVVEECDEYGEPLTNQWDETPPCSAPPVFTPPEVPEFLREADGVPEEISPAEETQIIVNKEESEPEVPPIVVEPTNSRFSMELSRDQQEHYGSQFQTNNVPTIDVRHVNEDGEEIMADDNEDEYGLGVAQIVITAATPMVEDTDHSFPPPEETPTNHVNKEEQSKVDAEETKDDVDTREQPQQQPVDVVPEEHIGSKSVSQQDSETIASEDAEDKSAIDDQPDSNQYPVSSSTEGDGETTGPSTAENSISNVPPIEDTEPKQVVGGRASIPDELEPHQLARLQDLKESNA
ncbi:fch and double sh3 domain protein [Holotrichia oblita]|uniref:Fch and double sh3 domain protein n=1 Tax=Holotrichia oblita TaxID=644536 RepID=A0ACB9TTM3_HOLOL|nr:fch and double sh3 domain protein [Holotrichia oblita]